MLLVGAERDAELMLGLELVLRRNRVGYLMAWFGCRLLTRSPIVRVDGPLSVAAAFTFDEARSLATRAGLAGAAVSGYFPERFLLVWRKPP